VVYAVIALTLLGTLALNACGPAGVARVDTIVVTELVEGEVVEAVGAWRGGSRG
jgi:hypothetical protein